MAIDYPAHGTMQIPIVRSLKGQNVYIRINDVSIKAIRLINFVTPWIGQNYNLITEEDVVFDGYTINTQEGLRRINEDKAEENVLDEMPYRCSHMNENFAMDIERQLIYFTDSKRLYAMKL